MRLCLVALSAINAGAQKPNATIVLKVHRFFREEAQAQPLLILESSPTFLKT